MMPDAPPACDDAVALDDEVLDVVLDVREADQKIRDDRLEIVAAVNGVAAGMDDDAGREKLVDQLQPALIPDETEQLADRLENGIAVAHSRDSDFVDDDGSPRLEHVDRQRNMLSHLRRWPTPGDRTARRRGISSSEYRLPLARLGRAEQGIDHPHLTDRILHPVGQRL
jgi:hypothetical protein